jgi:hypothetical protein
VQDHRAHPGLGRDERLPGAFVVADRLGVREPGHAGRGTRTAARLRDLGAGRPARGQARRALAAGAARGRGQWRGACSGGCGRRTTPGRDDARARDSPTLARRADRFGGSPRAASGRRAMPGVLQTLGPTRLGDTCGCREHEAGFEPRDFRRPVPSAIPSLLAPTGLSSLARQPYVQVFRGFRGGPVASSTGTTAGFGPERRPSLRTWGLGRFWPQVGSHVDQRLRRGGRG